MRIPKRTTQFKRDIKLASRRGKNLSKLEAVVTALIDEVPLDPKYRDHSLKGDFAGRRECHLESDWLLLYKLEHGMVIFERIGTHADLFE